MREYSFTKGLSKGLISVLTFAAAFAAFAGFADFTLWDLLEAYAKPVLGSLTVAGAITMAINYVKVRTSA